jgi:hypothetical protein
MPGYIVPQLREGELPALIEVACSGSLQSADDPIDDTQDLRYDGIVGKPTVKKDKSCINPCLLAAFKHPDQHIGFLLEGFHAPLPSSAAPVNLSQILIGPVLGCMKADINEIKINPIMLAYLEHLITKLRTLTRVIKMVAHKLHVTSCLMKQCIIGNENLLRKHSGIKPGLKAADY